MPTNKNIHKFTRLCAYCLSTHLLSSAVLRRKFNKSSREFTVIGERSQFSLTAQPKGGGGRLVRL